MSSWQYRVKHDSGGYHIIEYYTDPEGWTKPTYPYGETVDELREDLIRMLAALNKPVIED